MNNQPGQQNNAEQSPSDSERGKLQGKVALVVGGLGRNGRSLAVRLAEQGADVAYAYHPNHQQAAEKMADAIAGENQSALLMPVEALNRIKMKELMQHIQQRFGRLDIFIDNSSYESHASS